MRKKVKLNLIWCKERETMGVTEAEATSSGCACYRSFVFSGSCLVLLCTKEESRGRGEGACSMVNSCELGQTQRAKPALHAWGLWVWGLPEPFGGLRYAFICVSISFLLRISFGLYFFRSSRLVSAFVLFCFTRKKHFNLQMRNKFQTKAQSFPLQINF